MGLLDFSEIRPFCTEITLAVHYDIKNRFFAWLDQRLSFVDAFLNAELHGLREYLERVPARQREHVPVFRGFQPAAARA
jgi:hypothetical protein